MDSSNKALWVILGVPIAAIVFGMASAGPTDRARFDRLELGMSPQAVQAIVAPTARYGYRGRRLPDRFQMRFGNNDTIHLNDRMVLTFRDGRLVSKRWIEDKSK